MDGVFGDSQEDEDAAEDELEFFKYVQDEVLEAKILNMTTVPDSSSSQTKTQRGPGYKMPSFAVVRTPGLSPENTGTAGQVDCDQVFLEGLCASLSWTAKQQQSESKKTNPFTILWSDIIPLDVSAQLEKVKRLPASSRCNHFPEIEQLLDKCYLSTNLEMLRLTVGEDKLMKPSWPLPMRYNHLKMQIDNFAEDRYKAKTQPAQTFIIKFGKNNRGHNEPMASPDGKQTRGASRHHFGPNRPSRGPVTPDPMSDKPMLTQTTPARSLFSSRMCVAQLYMSNPYLLGGPKTACAFRLRTFALVTSVHPHLRAFLYREGVVRVAEEAFDPPQASNLHMHAKHIVDRRRSETWATASSVNSVVPDPDWFVDSAHDDWTSGLEEGEGDAAASAINNTTAPTDAAITLRALQQARHDRGADGRPGELLAGGGDGHLSESDANRHLRYQRGGKVWTLSAFLLQLHQQGHDIDKFWSSIEMKVQKILLSVKDQLNTAYCGTRGNNDVGFSCFELMAFDFIVDAKLEAWVADVDPVRFDVFSSQEIFIKSAMVKEALQLVAADPNILLGAGEDVARRCKKLKLSSSLSKRLRAQAKPAPTTPEATSSNNNESNDDADQKSIPDELGPKEWALLSRRREAYEDSCCDGFKRILPVGGRQQPNAAGAKGVDVEESEEVGAADPLHDFWDYKKQTNVSNTISFERKNYSRILRESRNLAKQQEQQREMEIAERAKSTAKFTQKMKEKYQATKSKVYSAPTPNSAEAAEIAKAKLKVRQQRERRAKKVRIQKSTNALAGQVVPIATFSLNGNLQNVQNRQQTQRKRRTSGNRWYGERKRRDSTSRPRFRGNSMNVNSDHSPLNTLVRQKSLPQSTETAAAAALAKHGGLARGAAAAPDPLFRYHHHHTMGRRREGSVPNVAQMLHQPISKERPAGTIPKLGPSVKTRPPSPIHVAVHNSLHQRLDCGHAGRTAATPPSSPRDIAYEQLARNINDLVAKSPMNRRINVLNSNASRWLKQQPNKAAPVRRRKEAGLVIQRVREDRDRSRQMSRERAIRLLNNIL